MQPLAALATASGYKIVLPKGTKYNSLSGPSSSDLTVRVYGLRHFTIPFLQDLNTQV